MNDLRKRRGLSQVEPIAGYTIGSAYANPMGVYAGSTEVGKAADLVLLSKDLFSVPYEQIRDTRVLLTLVNGKEVFRHPDFTAAIATVGMQ